MQIGCRFWDLVLREHATYSRGGLFDEPMSTFFRNVDARFEDFPDIPPKPSGGLNKIHTLKARAILVDMEEGVLNSLLTGPFKDIFDSRQRISDVSGAGNNWAHGHQVYGPQYSGEILDKVRRSVELCDSLQCFFLMHSLGGGTGSGLGTFILQLLQDEYPDVHRFVTAVFPSDDDDVVTSPYNSVLAMHELTEHADCVLPIDNQSLIDIGKMIGSSKPAFQKSNILQNSSPSSGSPAGIRLPAASENPFDRLNNIAAHVLTNLTA